MRYFDNIEMKGFINYLNSSEIFFSSVFLVNNMKFQNSVWNERTDSKSCIEINSNTFLAS